MAGCPLSRSLGVMGLVACCLGGSGAIASADPIVVTSGHLDTGRGAANASLFTFAGADGFVLFASGVSTAFASPSCLFTGCRPGDTFNPSLVAGSASGVRAGVSLPAAFTLGTAFSAVVDGTAFAPPVDFITSFPGPLGLAGSLHFDAEPFVVPETATFFRSPFVLSGHVTGFGIGDVDARHPLFDADLAGQGTALVDFEDRTTRLFFAATAAPTPEPATLLLLGTALVGVAARSRRSRGNCLSQGAPSRGPVRASLRARSALLL